MLNLWTNLTQTGKNLIYYITVLLIAVVASVSVIPVMSIIFINTPLPIVDRGCDYDTPPITWGGRNNNTMLVNKNLYSCGSTTSKKLLVVSEQGVIILPTTENEAIAIFDVSNFDFKGDWHVTTH